MYANLADSAARLPKRAAIDYYGGQVATTAEAPVDALAGYLQKWLGVASGDRVLLYAQNCPQFVIGYYAILRADAVVVPVNPMNRAEELRRYVEDSDARAGLAGRTWCANSAARPRARAADRVRRLIDRRYDLPVPDFVRTPGARAWTKRWPKMGSSRDRTSPVPETSP